MAVNSERGSEWNRWDLHVHTPCSIIQNYGGDTDEVWERYIEDLEALPESVKVVGINDYMFTDGYRKVLQYRDSGRLRNLDLILPVCELRMKAFSGTEGRLRRVNLHVLFSDKISPDIIDAQFLSAICPHYQLAPRYSELSAEWQMAPTRDSLEELGRLVLKTIPEQIHPPTTNRLQVGFDAVNFDVEKVRQVLSRPHFLDRHLLAIGKTEWWDLKWNEQSVAEKKDLINKCALVFTAAVDTESWRKSREALTENGVENRLLDCSDAHDFSDSEEKDRIGNCLTWLKADRTFAGLRHSLMEYDERVVIGEMPPQLQALKEAPSRFIDSVSLAKVPNAKTDELWFDQEIPLNAGLVAVIGNRGSGKSALIESLALTANTHRTQFSFLSRERFRRGGNGKAADFSVELQWMNGSTASRNLADPCDFNRPEEVQFIPQRFLETVCNELPGGDEQEFDRELKRVIFSHLSEVETLGKDNLDDLLEYVSEAVEEDLTKKREQLAELNTEITALRRKAEPSFESSLRSERERLRQKLRDLREAEPSPVPPPEQVDDPEEVTQELTDLREQNEEAEKAIAELKNREKHLAKQSQNLDTFGVKLTSLEQEVQKFKDDGEQLLEDIDLAVDDLFTFEIDRTPLDDIEAQVETELKQVRKDLDEENDEGPVGQMKERTDRIEELQKQLGEPGQRYQQYLDKRNEWLESRQEVIGSASAPGTLQFLNRRVRELATVPERLDKARDQRVDLTRSIAETLHGLCDRYRELYEPVQRIIEDHEIGAQLGLAFDVGLVDSGLRDSLFGTIDRRVSGTFAGKSEGQQRLQSLLDDADLDNPSHVLTLTQSILDRLDCDFKQDPPVENDIWSQLREGKDLHELLTHIFGLEWLEPRYRLRFQGKELHQLSPGEKGTILLIFYLLVDKSDQPLIIDQPEDNLDNQTVVKILVDSVKDARKRRQLVLVTHNPNLAVLCDADQVIACFMYIEEGKSVRYFPGAIENPQTNKHLINILEGTKPAFQKRGERYEA